MTKHWLTVLILWIFIAVACDPCEDCGEPLLYDPTVNVIFINKDSLDTLNERVGSRDDIIDRLDSVENILDDSLDLLQDTLEVINDSIEAGIPGYEDARSAIERLIRLSEDSVAVLQGDIRNLDSLNKIDNSIISVINSGKLKVDMATLRDNGAVLEYEDSATVFSVPLLMDVNETSYMFVIRQDTVFMRFDYSLVESVNEARVYRIRAANIRVDVQEPDSIGVIKCLDPDNCLSNETTVTVYYR